MLMVKTKEDKNLKRRVKAIEKESRKQARNRRKTAKRELKEYRSNKIETATIKKMQAQKEIDDSKARIELVKKNIVNNANAVTSREIRGVKRFLKKVDISERIFLGFIVNLVFSIFEFIGGAFSGSVAIMTDAIHDLGDAISLGFATYFEKKSKHGPDKTYTYGYSRFSILGVFVTSIILAVGASFMIFISISRLTYYQPVNAILMLILSVIGLFINTMAAFRTKNGRFNVLKAINQGAVNDIILEDVIGWMVVLAGTIVMLITGWGWIDPLMSIIIAIYLMFSSFDSFKKIIDLFLEKVPEGTSVDVVKYQVLAIPHVKDVHSIHLWSMDRKDIYATMHVVVDGKIVDGIFIEGSVENSFNIKKEIRKQLKTTGIKEVTIEIETEGEICKK